MIIFTFTTLSLSSDPGAKVNIGSLVNSGKLNTGEEKQRDTLISYKLQQTCQIGAKLAEGSH